MSNALKLIAQDDEQLTIISSLAQDSIIKTNEMGYDKKTKRFALLMNRYRHEEENPSRIRTAIHFDFVDAVKSVGIDKQSSDDILVLLAIRFEGKSKPSGSIFLEFSNNKSITVDVESIEAFLTDMGEPWKIPNKPVHDEG
tara:strand:- start:476 stop:898 length:423 start_codon:yes stop_codon:yes gene_type:complete